WSFESAIFCSAMWLPAHGLLLLSRSKTIRQRMASVLLSFAVPGAFLLSAVLAIQAYYVAFLGRGPDWPAFWEYSLTFKGGYGGISMDVQGPVWILLLVFAGISTVVVYQLITNLASASSALICGTWAMLWSTTSYFILRSHPNVLTN